MKTRTSKTTITTKSAGILAGLLLISSIMGYEQADASVETPEYTLNPTTCETLLGGIWDSDTCTSTDHPFDQKIRVTDGITWVIIGKFVNGGAIVLDKGATMSINGWGVSSNGKVINNGVIVNDGTIECKRCGFINQNTVVNTGVIENNFKMSSNHKFYNLGTIYNNHEFLNRGSFFSCHGEIIGNPIGINSPVPIC